MTHSRNFSERRGVMVMQRSGNLLFVGILAGVSMVQAYHVKLDNQTPFKVVLECELVGKKKPVSTAIGPYASGAVDTAGARAKATYLHVSDKTGVTHRRFFAVQYPLGHKINDRNLVLYAGPVMRGTKVDRVFLTLLDTTLEKVGANDAYEFATSGNLALRPVK